MRVVFLYGPPASGKLTIARLVSGQTGIPVFHNHLIVDAVSAVFPFGSDAFVRLREEFWLQTVAEAARTGQSLIFTFAPEATVTPDFPARLVRTVADLAGEVTFIALDIEQPEQERRLTMSDRAAFGKLRSVELLRELRPSMTACMEAMPPPLLRIDTGATAPADAARAIVDAIGKLEKR